jgi:nitrate/TMAO reductase-like tetraheme cytochrome c subunit
MSRVVIWSFLAVSLVLWSIPATSLADETVCLQCHAGLSGHLSAPVADWQTSVHAENGISCHDCHGGDPTDMAMAKSPDRGFVGAPDYTEVPDFCGRCHVGVAEEYKAGAHGKANEEDCSRCHSYERAALIRLSLVETDTMIKDVEHDLDRLYRLGFAVDEMQGTLFNQRNIFHRTFHGVDVERVRKETGGVQAELTKIKGQVADVDKTLGQRKLWGSVVIGLFILVGVIFLLVRKAYEEEGG